MMFFTPESLFWKVLVEKVVEIQNEKARKWLAIGIFGVLVD